MLLLPYRSYGTVNRLYLVGRVLDDKPLPPPPERDSFWRGLRAMWKRIETDEVPGAEIEITFGVQTTCVVTDEEGYFKLNLTPETPLPWNDGWHPVPLRLVGLPKGFRLKNEQGEDAISATATVLVPPPDAEFGIVSDIDDTILETDATSLPRMFRNTFLRAYRQRLPFAGVAEFYRALQLGLNGKRNNPVFYVSSSPWNLYDLLDDYMKHHGLPAGPILLRDFGIRRRNLREGHLDHKLREISQVFDTYPHLPFVLIGDSGQRDPVIYREVVRRYPGRVKAIYIRDVEAGLPASERDAIVTALAAEIEADGVPMLLVPDTAAAAAHAAEIGLIARPAVAEVAVEAVKA
jgi:phosphatidate phosphatase APP1